MKQTYALILLGLFSLSAYAQNPASWQPYVRAGAGVSRAIGDALAPGIQSVYTESQAIVPHLGGRNWITAGDAGVGFVRPVSNQFYLQVEADVSLKGSSMDLNKEIEFFSCGIASCYTGPVYGSFSSRVLYVTLPVMAGYHMGKLAFAAGPYVGIKAAEWQQGTYSIGVPAAVPYPIGDSGRHYKSVDLGFSGELSYALTRLVGVDLRYSQGLLTLAKPYDRNPELSFHQTVQVGLRYGVSR